MDKNDKILIIGDWTIDQNWICGIQRSSLSSRTGLMHLRGLNEKDGATESLCGAGVIASIIHRAEIKKSGDKEPYNVGIVGVGLWHDEDSDYLTDMIHRAEPDIKKGRHKQPSKKYTRSFKAKNGDPNIVLYNVSGNIDEDARKKAGTTRIIRIYKHVGSNAELQCRIDWEPTLVDNDNRNYWIENDKEAENLLEYIKSEEKNTEFKGVVIKCLNKKVISNSLVRVLASDETFKTVPWYISTKIWNPGWLDHLKSVDCRLLIIPKPAVDTAKTKGDTTQWINRNGFGTKKALKKIFDLRDKLKIKNSEDVDCYPTIVVLPSGHRIIAVGPGNLSGAETQEDNIVHDLLIVQNERKTFQSQDPLRVDTPFASIMFGALITLDLAGYEKETQKNIERSLEFTKSYIRSENKRLTKPEEWMPENDEVSFKIDDKVVPQGKFHWRSDTTLKKAMDEWDSATNNLGIIEKSDDLTIELFRGATEVDKYICLSYDLTQSLQMLTIALKQFKSNPIKKSSSCIVLAPPGTGKTKLAKSLAASSGYKFLEFNITQMYSRDHLVDLFDRITTEQAQNRDIPLLVFIDEINANLEGEPVYSAFLAPLEDGKYVRSEKFFHIEPCFWIFAGTNNPDKDEDSHKWDDFRSRLTLPEINLFKQDVKTIKLETVYVCLSILVDIFPDVRWVTKKVLRLFWFLGSVKGIRVRQLVKFIRTFSDISHGIVSSANIDLLQLDSNKIIWRNKHDKQLWDEIDENIKGNGLANETNGAIWCTIEEGERLVRIVS